MSFEKPNIQESPEARLKKYAKEALEIAQRASQKWQNLREKIQENPHLLASYPKLDEINSLSAPPVSGIQRYFEGQMQSIQNVGDAPAKSQMAYRLIEDLKEIQRELDEVLK